MREGKKGIGGGDGSKKGGGGSLPRPTKFSSLMHSDPLIKSTSEEEFSTRNSSASAASPGYYSDRSSTTTSTQQTSSADSSPLHMSPWNHHASSSPLSSHNTNPFLDADGSAIAPAPATDLFPPGTGLMGSLVREEGHIYSLAAIGDLLYTGSDSKNIRVWRDQKEYSGFKSKSGLVKAIVISGDHRVFTGHQDGKIRVWRVSPKNPRAHKKVGTLPRLKDYIKKSMNPSNYVDARRRHQRSAVWIRHSDAVSCLTLSEDQTLLYSGSWDRTVKVWRLADSRCVESLSAHDDAVNAVAAAFEGLVFTGSADGTVKVWRREETAPAAAGSGVKKGKGAWLTRHAAVQTLVRQECAVTALAVCAEARAVYAGSSDGVVHWWQHNGGGGGGSGGAHQPLEYGGVLRGHRAAVLCLAAAGRLLFSGSADKTICMWRREDGDAHECLSVLTGHEGPVKCLTVEADPAAAPGGCSGGGRWVVYSGSLDKSVKVWKVADPPPPPGTVVVAHHHQQRQIHGRHQQMPSESDEADDAPRFDMF